jgi:hypothetical protein
VNGPSGLPPVLVTPGQAISARLQSSNTGFAMLLGGGLDIKVSKHVAFRPFETDYYRSEMPNLLADPNNRVQHNFRYAAGVNFLFGAK